MNEKLIPVTVMLLPEEIKIIKNLSEQDKRSKRDLLRLAFLCYIKANYGIDLFGL